MSMSDNATSIEVPAGLLIFDIADRLGRELHVAAQRQAVLSKRRVITEQHVRDAITDAVHATFSADENGGLSRRAA